MKELIERRVICDHSKNRKGMRKMGRDLCLSFWFCLVLSVRRFRFHRIMDDHEALSFDSTDGRNISTETTSL